jgi:predicted metalloprotease with PDZ domain
VIKFLLNLYDSKKHLVELTCSFKVSNKKKISFSLPKWSPGSYLIRDYARHIVNLEVTLNNEKVFPKQKTSNNWEIYIKSNGLINIKYLIYCFDKSVRANYLDDNRLFLNGPSTFLRVKEFSDKKHQLEIKKNVFLKNKKITSSMNFLKQKNLYQEICYQEFIDHPFEISNTKNTHFYIAKNKFTLSLSNLNIKRVDLKKINSDTKIICNQIINFWGNNPNKEYHFLINCEKNGYGGLEHKSSSALLIDEQSLPKTKNIINREKYINFLGLCSHEYFHVWNVKRLKPKNLVNINFDSENYTSLLWFFEGFTSFYDDFLLLRSSLITPEEYIKIIEKKIDHYNFSPGNKIQNLADSSFYAWIMFYKAEDNYNNFYNNYYLTGSLVALMLDIEINHDSNFKQSLDDLMKTLWSDFGKNESGINEKNIFDKTRLLYGVKITSLLKSFVYDPKKLNFKNTFSKIGLAIEEIKQKPNKPVSYNNKIQLLLGIRLKSISEPIIKYISHESCLFKKDIKIDDKVLEINDFDFNSNKKEIYNSIFTKVKKLKVIILRNGKKITIKHTYLKLGLPVKIKITDNIKFNSWINRKLKLN